MKEDALESLYERRLRKKSLDEKNEESGLEVDPVDALPVKTLDGKLYYRTGSYAGHLPFVRYFLHIGYEGFSQLILSVLLCSTKDQNIWKCTK